ncbi:hypothetical protein [Candidatus Methanarcanum hacksteinii]|uniref:hypothetical protein n=1 Tax=Candidatus Methanarcanum hacksteinii TaxID=2911857 RepID=UPI0037DD2336
MKTKMESAFAFIAVALMIMVAVVPMVGVFTEDSSADTVIPGTNEVTVSGTVKDGSGTGIEDALVKIEANSKLVGYGETNVDGSYSIKLYIDDKLTFKVSVVTDAKAYASYMGAGAVNPAASYKFAEQTFTDVKADVGNIENVNFKDGNVAISGKLLYKNGEDYAKSGLTVTAKYKVGTSDKTPTGTTDKDGKYMILVPSDAKVIVSASGFESSKEIDVETTKEANLTHAKLNLGTVDADVPDLFKDLEIKLTMTKKGDNVEKADVLDSGKVVNNIVMFEYSIKDGATDKLEVEIKDNLGLGKVKKVDELSDSVSYDFNAYIYGAIMMKNVKVLSATVAIKTYKEVDGKDVEVGSISGAKLIGNTYYAAFGATTISDDVKKIKVTVDANGNKKTFENIFTKGSGATEVNADLDAEGYNLITVNVKNGSDAAVSGVEIVLDKDAIGAVSKKLTTGDDGSAKFYVKTGSVIKITPTGTFDVKDRTFTVVEDTEVTFKIDTKELTGSAIKDAAGNVITGVTVNYKVPGAASYTTVTSDKDGYKITVNSNVDAKDVKVYFAKEKYTFAAKDDDTAIAMDKAKDVKAKEQTYTFTLADAKDVAIKDLTGITVSVAKYKIHTAGSSVVYDGTDGVAIIPVNGVYSFIGSSDYVGKTGEYRVSYCVKVATSADSKYTFAQITEYADKLVVKANEYTLTGYVKDAADVTPVKNVVVESSIVSDDSVKTTEKGYFSILVNALEDTITVASGSGYTFKDVKVAGEKEITIKANEKTFTGTLKDADGKAITAGSYEIKVMNGTTPVGANATVKADGTFTIVTAVAEGYKLKATDSAGTRTFAPITLKGTETTLDVVSEQATYSGKVFLADGTTALKDVVVEVWKTSTTENDVKVKTNPTEIKTVANGSYSVLLSVADDKAYVVKGKDAGAFKFSTTGVAFKDYVADIKSTTKITDTGVETNTIALKDAVGEKLGAGYVVKAYYMTGSGATAKYDLIGTFTTDKNGEFKCLYTGAGYVFNVTSPSGSVYTFKEYDVATSVINAKESTKEGTLKSQNNVAIPDATISFLDNDGKVLTTAKTDADGKWTATLIVGDVKKITANTSKYGAITLDQATIADNLVISEYIYSGLYANGEVVSGVVVVFEMKNGSTFIQMGKAAIVDDKYYVVADNAFATGYTMTVSATASNFNAYGTYAADAVAMNLNVGKKPGVVSIATDDVFFGEFYTVYNATNAQVGDKIILRASEVAYKPLEDGNETTVVKYKFNGWYVNGVKVSDDLEYVYTVTEDCLVYADYKASTYETASDDNGISPSVLVIGIAAVIVALIAVVYTVIQKKE